MTAALPYFLFALLIAGVGLALMADRSAVDQAYKDGFAQSRRDRLKALQEQDPQPTHEVHRHQ